jgi:hypothetical protein
MKSTARLCLGLLTVTSFFAFAGCSGDDDDAAGNTTAGGSESAGGAPAEAVGGNAASVGALECEVIGELCHEADAGSGAAHDCHETGHIGKASVCVAEFSGCIGTCVHDEDAGSGGAPAETQDPYCAALGELCHPVDDATGPTHQCHLTGHIGNGADCAAKFDECATLCLAKRAEQEAEPGAGGSPSGGAGGTASTEAGAPSSAGGAAGTSSGGAP